MKRNFSLFLVVILLGCRHPQQPLWQWTLQSRCYADPVVNGKMVFVASAAGELICGDLVTGGKIWETKLAGPILAAPVVSAQQLYVATQTGSVYALQKETGDVAWHRTFQADAFEADLSLSENTLFVPSRNGILYALSPTRGEVLWKQEGNRKYTARVVTDGRHLFIGGWNRNFLCFLANGNVSWNFQATEPIVQDAIVSNNRVFFATRDHLVYALDVPTGKLLWRFETMYPTNLILAGNQLLFGSGTELVVMRPENGQVSRRIQTGRPVSRLYSWHQGCFMVSGAVYQIDPVSAKISKLLQMPESFYKVAFAQDIWILSDDLYSVFGFRRP